METPDMRESRTSRPGAIDVVSAKRASKARTALSLLFLMNGLTFGTWAALIPSFQQKFLLPTARLSWVLFAMVAGAMLSMSLSGRMIERWGSRRVAFPGGLGFAVMLVAAALAPTYSALIVAAAFFGLCKGAFDVSINAQAITVENAAARPILASFQGFWSFGGLIAAALLSGLMERGFSPAQLTMAMGALLVGLVFSTLGRLLPDSNHARDLDRARGERPERPWLLGGLAFLALFSEGVMFDWSAVYTHTVGGLSVALAPTGFAAFALCMAGGRFLGDALTARVGALMTLRFSGLVMAGGIAAAVATHSWPVILAGFALVGLGTANIVPVLFGVAGRLKGHGAGSGLAAVTTMGYFGFLVGPPLIGFLATLAGLPIAVSVVIACGLVMATAGVAVVRRAAHSRRAF